MTATPAADRPPGAPLTTRRRLPLIGLLAANGASLIGTRLSMIALPWLVLTTTGSATQTGIVVFCEAAPLVLSKSLCGPLIDRVGPRPVSVVADIVSALVIGTIPLLYALDRLPFWLFLVLVAAVGTARGPGDAAKQTLVPEVAQAAGTPLERATGLVGTMERVAGAAGPALAGVLVAVFSPMVALALNAVTFAVSAVIILSTTRRRTTRKRPTTWKQGSAAVPSAGVGSAPDPTAPGYLRQLREGFAFLRADRLLWAITMMVAVTNMIDAAWGSVLIPVWAQDSGGGPAAIGAVGSVFGISAVVGSVLATAFAQRLPRRTTYVLGFLIGGAPRFVALALGAPLWAVLAVSAADGLAIGFINPLVSAVLLERIPRPLLGRVSALTSSLAFAGIPLGGLLAGFAITAIGLAPTLLLAGGIYLLVTMAPVFSSVWRQLDDPPLLTADDRAPTPRTAAPG